MASSIREFDEAPPITVESRIDEAIAYLLTHSEHLTEEHVGLLRSNIPDLAASNEFGADFRLSDEVQQQLTLVTILRKKIMSADGRSLNVSAREAKEVVSASTSLIQMLMKSQKEILSMDRNLAIQGAVAAAMENVPEEVRMAFFDELEARLARVE